MISNMVSAQRLDLFEKFDFDSTYAVVGIAAWGATGVDKEFDFIVNTPADLAQLKEDWVFTDKAPRYFDNKKCLNIYVIRNKKIVSSSLIDLTYSNIIGSGEFYAFDKKKLRKLHREHNFEYQFQKLVFNTAEQYNAYLDSALLIPSFVFMTNIGKVYDGEFTVTIKKTDTTSSPAAAIGVLSKQILEYASKDEFRPSYKADEYNVAHPNDMRITVSSSKKVYEKFVNNGYKVGEWEPLTIQTTSFWKL